MIPYLAHIYGPLYLNTYGLFIFLAVWLFYALLCRDTKIKQLIQTDQLATILGVGIALGVLGGRLLWAITNWSYRNDSLYDLIAVWHGGFSILGTVIAVAIGLPLFLSFKKIPVVRFLDRVALYAPLAQAIARIGCFFVGCCNGCVTDMPWGVMYTHPDSKASLLYTPVHPTQLYSSICLLLLFGLLFIMQRKSSLKPGQLACLYLMGTSIERFTVDFWRDERVLFGALTEAQWVAVGIFVVASIIFCTIGLRKSSKRP